MAMHTILLSTLLAFHGGAPPQIAETAIVGARLEIGDGRVLENGTLAMRGDKIVLLGEGLPAPSGSTVIDGKGLTVYPGFFDCYSTTGVKQGETVANVGASPDTTNTAPATMWHGNRKNLHADVKAATALDPKTSFSDRIAQGITTVLFTGGSGTIAGTAALVDLSATPTVLVPEAAEEFIFRSAGRFGGGEDMAGAQGRRPQQDDGPPVYAYPGTLFGITALTRQTLWDAKAYAAEDKPKTDATYEGLRPLVTGRMPAMFTLTNAREIARAGHLADEFGFQMIVNGVPDAYREADALKAHAAPVIVSLEVPDAPSQTSTSVPKRVLEDRLAQYKERMTNARQLDAAGVTIAFRKGSGDYLEGVRKLVTASGLPRASALRAMTSSPATIFGVADRTGTLQVGKTANLVLMTGDFLDPKSTVKTTIVQGVATDAKKKETAK